MRMMRSALLGSAAALAAVGQASAADLPVKAKPVEYVKICSLYGAGYYYIPGSDTCIKFGGYVRADYGWNVNGARTPQYSGATGAQDRTVAQLSTRHRANIQIDTRTQTAYGTLRTFTSLHFNYEDGGVSPNVARAMIQWAGFTFGRAQSFSDTWGITDSWHYLQQQNDSTTGANGVNQIAYTWELGSGMTFTIGADEARRKNLPNLSPANVLTTGSNPTTAAMPQRIPDIYGAFKVNQAWGYWGVSVIAHDVAATYYGTGAGCDVGITSPCGYPDDKWGWAVQTGGEFKLDFINPGDRIGFVVRYSQGASAWGGGSNLNSPGLFGSGNQVAIGWITDGVFVDNGDIQLTTAWSVGAGYEHYWSPKLKTSFYGEYTQIRYNDTAASYIANQVGCDGTTTRVDITSGSCDPNWSFFMTGMRTQWSPAAGFILGVDVGWTRVLTAFDGATANLSGASGGAVIGGRAPGNYRLDDQDIYSVVFRAQRNFNVGD